LILIAPVWICHDFKTLISDDLTTIKFSFLANFAACWLRINLKGAYRAFNRESTTCNMQIQRRLKRVRMKEREREREREERKREKAGWFAQRWKRTDVARCPWPEADRDLMALAYPGQTAVGIVKNVPPSCISCTLSLLMMCRSNAASGWERSPKHFCAPNLKYNQIQSVKVTILRDVVGLDPIFVDQYASPDRPQLDEPTSTATLFPLHWFVFPLVCRISRLVKLMLVEMSLCQRY